MISDNPVGYLKLKVELKPQDRLLKAPVYLFPVNILERGLLSGIRLTRVTAMTDAANGRVSVVPEEAEVFMPEVEPEAQELARRFSLREARMAAEELAVPEETRGWKRGFRTSTLLFREEEFRFVWRLYIIRGPLLIDTFTGEESEAAALISRLFGQSQNEGRPAEL